MAVLAQCHSSLLLFVGFGLAVAAIHYCLPVKWRFHWLLLVSACFYAGASGWMTFGLFGEAAWTWFCALRLERQHEVRRNQWLWFGVAPIVLVLVFFKYNGFFLENCGRVLAWLGLEFAGTGRLIMPLGISYFTFKNISYLADVYKAALPAERNFVRYASYSVLFTQVTCGPIARYADWQQGSPFQYKPLMFQQGFSAIFHGLFMKLVIANRLAAYTGEIFHAPDGVPGLALWLAAFFYAIQLYCDFAGYSYIAIGLTKILGLPCRDNFHRPYLAKDIRDFWSRWHISLSSWLRDYVYIPLGGGRCPRWRKNLNVLVTFLVSGLWHGVGMNFVVWGLWHGLLNVLTPKIPPQ